jgi:rubrerythrin
MRVRIDKAGKIMVTDFSLAQSYKIAVRMEKDGIDFYGDLLAGIRNAQAKHEIEFLIDEEKRHLEIFQGLLDRAKEAGVDDFEEDDVVDYLRSKVFDVSQEKDRAENMEHRHTALEEALDMERRSIVFYEGCLSHAKDAAAKEAFQKILEEEQKHQAKFAQLLRTKCIDSGEGCIF